MKSMKRGTTKIKKTIILEHFGMPKLQNFCTIKINNDENIFFIIN